MILIFLEMTELEEVLGWQYMSNSFFHAHMLHAITVLTCSEFIVLKINRGSNNIIVIGIYRPPSDDYQLIM